MTKIGIAADHGGFAIKEQITAELKTDGFEVVDFGAYILEEKDDYPDFIIPLARAVSMGEIGRGIAICGSGVGASIAANKISGVRAALINDSFSAHQGVEDDNMNIICFGGRIIGYSLMLELTKTFLQAKFSGAERHKRRLQKISDLENRRIQNERSSE
ncbi:MAG: RpiB/LacA/LacB family sugar-phosphate isomerase [Ignavibacteriales bacterium]